MSLRLMLDKKEMTAFVRSVGTKASAATLIERKLRCCRSKAEKLAAGTYTSRLSLLEQIALAELMSRPLDKLFKGAS